MKKNFQKKASKKSDGFNKSGLVPWKTPLKTVLIYFVISFAWILFSDEILHSMLHDMNLIAHISIFKGILFVLITGIIAYFILQRDFIKIRVTQDELMGSFKALKNSEERFRLAIEGSNDGIWDWDVNSDIAEISNEWAELLGLEATLISSYVEKWREQIHPEDEEHSWERLQDQLLNKNIVNYRNEYRLKTKNGNFIWVYSRGKILRDETGKAVRIAGSHTDITDRMNIQSKFERLAYYDDLTELPNRTMFTYLLNIETEKHVMLNEKFAVLFMDIDNYKNINDTYGYEFGDKFIKEVSQQLKEIEKENMVISRFGGNEFAVLIKNYKTLDEIKAYANKIIEIFKSPWMIEAKQFFSKVSIGITLCPEDGVETEQLLRNADMATYKAKEMRISAFSFYKKEIYTGLVEKTNLEKSLKLAMLNNELILYYQPQVYLGNYDVMGVEALVRWNNPEKGLVSPAVFIPLAEETGLITDIGYWVFRESCRQAKRFETELKKEMIVSINVSALQLQDENFVPTIQRIIQEEDIKPGKIIVEITESVIINNFETNRQVLDNLRSLGIKIALDDFGTGYSSLSYLNQITIDEVKIDRSFINDFTNDKQRMAIVDTIIDLSHKLGFEVTAEGVEKEEELIYLHERKCDKIQGFLLSQPVRGEDISDISLTSLNDRVKGWVD